MTSFVHNLCKHFVLRSWSTEHPAWSGSKLYETMINSDHVPQQRKGRKKMYIWKKNLRVETIVVMVIRVRILARILAKCELKKQLARWYFLYLHFLASGNLGLLSVVLILDINLLSSFLKWCSFHFYPSEKPCQWQRFTLDTTSMRRRIL